MPVNIKKTRLVYVPVPKIACTSIKKAILIYHQPQILEIEKALIAEGEKLQVHSYYDSVPLRNSHYLTRRPFRKWFAMVRDPLRRFVSGYRNRIVFHQDLNETDASVWRDAGVPAEPDIDEFVAHLDVYSHHNLSTHHHFDPMTVFLGRHPWVYDRLFCMSEMTQLQDYLVRHGLPREIPHKQTGGPKMSVSDLSSASIAKLREIYAEDYAIWGKHIRESDGT